LDSAAPIHINAIASGIKEDVEMTRRIDRCGSRRRQHRWLCAALALAPVFFGVSFAAAAGAHVVAVAHFAFEQQAQQHCPDDSIVWAIARSGIYHANTERWYGQTSDGSYVCRRDAEAAGYVPSHAVQ
jgi:hypothetical protein